MVHQESTRKCVPLVEARRASRSSSALYLIVVHGIRRPHTSAVASGSSFNFSPVHPSCTLSSNLHIQIGLSRRDRIGSTLFSASWCFFVCRERAKWACPRERVGVGVRARFLCLRPLAPSPR